MTGPGPNISGSAVARNGMGSGEAVTVDSGDSARNENSSLAVILPADEQDCEESKEMYGIL